MPNLCDNTLIIKGTGLQKFVDQNMNQEQSLCFESSVPYGSYDDRKEWNVENWGTSCDAYDSQVKIDGESAVYYFCTAWDPPLVWLTTVSNRYPGLLFDLEYLEIGMDLWGHVVIQNGKTLFCEQDGLIDHAWKYIGNKVVNTIETKYKTIEERKGNVDIIEKEIDQMLHDAENDYHYILKEDIVEKLYC